MAALASGQSVDFGSLASVAAQLLAGNDNSVHSLASALLGSGAPAGVDVSKGVGDDILGNLAKAAFGGGVAGIDLSDGIGLDDLMGFANVLLGGKNADTTLHRM